MSSTPEADPLATKVDRVRQLASKWEHDYFSAFARELREALADPSEQSSRGGADPHLESRVVTETPWEGAYPDYREEWKP